MALERKKKSSCILNVLRRFTACQIRVPFVMRGRHSVSFPARCVHVQMPVHVCGQSLGMHHTHRYTSSHSSRNRNSSQACYHLNSSPMVSPKDISIFITLAEVIKENYEEEEEGKKTGFCDHLDSSPHMLNGLSHTYTQVAGTQTQSQRRARPLHGEKIHLLESVSM